MIVFTLILFPAWIFYESFVYVFEYLDAFDVLYINILSFPVPFSVYYTLSFGHYFYITLAYLIFYIALGVYINVKMFR